MSCRWSRARSTRPFTGSRLRDGSARSGESPTTTGRRSSTSFRLPGESSSRWRRRTGNAFPRRSTLSLGMREPASMVPFLKKLRRRVLALFRGRHMEEEMAEEMRLHLEMQAEEHVQAGVDPVEAALRARRDFGHMDGRDAACRDERGFVWVSQMCQDLRYGPVSYTHLRAHETGRNLVCRLLLEKKKQ